MKSKKVDISKKKDQFVLTHLYQRVMLIQILLRSRSELFLYQVIASTIQLPQNYLVYFPHHCRRFKLQNKGKHTNVLLINMQLLYTLVFKELILTTRWKQNALVMFLYTITYRNSVSQHFTSYRYFKFWIIN